MGTRPTTCSRAMQSSHAQHSAQYRFTCECVVNLTPGCCVNGRPLASAAIADDYPAYTIYLCPTMAHRSFVNQLLPSSIRQARSPRLYPSTNTTARRSYIYGFLAAVFVSVCTSPIWTVPSRHNRGGSSAPPPPWGVVAGVSDRRGRVREMERSPAKLVCHMFKYAVF